MTVLSSKSGDPRLHWFLREILPHEPVLRRWLERRCGPGIDVEDLIQESYSLLAGLETYDTIRHPRAYLFQTARSLMIRQVRRARIVAIEALSDLGEDGLFDDQPLPDTVVQDRDTLRNLAAAIEALPPQARRALILRRVHEMSQQEIARAMGLSESTVEKHLARALKSLIEWRRSGGNRPAQVSRVLKPNTGTADGPKTDQPRNRRPGGRLGRALRPVRPQRR